MFEWRGLNFCTNYLGLFTLTSSTILASSASSATGRSISSVPTTAYLCMISSKYFIIISLFCMVTELINKILISEPLIFFTKLYCTTRTYYNILHNQVRNGCIFSGPTCCWRLTVELYLALWWTRWEQQGDFHAQGIIVRCTGENMYAPFNCEQFIPG